MASQIFPVSLNTPQRAEEKKKRKKPQRAVHVQSQWAGAATVTGSICSALREENGLLERDRSATLFILKKGSG